MKIFRLHWVGHLLYLAALAGLVFYGNSRLKRIAFLKDELGQTQRRAVSEISRIREREMYEIVENANILPAERHRQIRQNALRAVEWITVLKKKCDHIRERFRKGEQPGQIAWRSDLLDNYYALGDSLANLYGADSLRQVWLERCLLTDYRDFPPAELARLLASSDTTDAARICRNLHLKAELALKMTLTRLAKNMYMDEIRFDRLMPILAYAECPRAGIPFKADIYMYEYSSVANEMKTRVNNLPVPVKDGLGRYSTVFKKAGLHSFKVTIQIRNPLTSEFKNYQSDYEVLVSDSLPVH